jgi:hypothetical protein
VKPPVDSAPLNLEQELRVLVVRRAADALALRPQAAGVLEAELEQGDRCPPERDVPGESGQAQLV